MILVSRVLWNLDLLLWMRHLVVLLLSGRVSEPRWCHSGSWAFEVRCGPILISAKFDVVCFRSFEHRAGVFVQFGRFLLFGGGGRSAGCCACSSGRPLTCMSLMLTIRCKKGRRLCVNFPDVPPAALIREAPRHYSLHLPLANDGDDLGSEMPI